MLSASKRLLTSKRTVLVLMVLLLFSVLLSLLIPQRFSTPVAEFSRWQSEHQTLLPIVEILDLYRLFTAPWFVVLLFFFLLSLAITTHGQFGIALMKTLGIGNRGVSLCTVEGLPSDASVELDLSEQEIKKKMRRAGYLKIGHEQGLRRYVKHPWGYWGLFFLHLGMLIAVASSLVVSTTEKRGALKMIEGEIHTPGNPWQLEERGLLAAPFVLPEALRLQRVSPEFWPRGGMKNIRSEVHFISQEGRTTKHTIAFTPILNYRGLRIYQGDSFGNAFYLVFEDEGNKREVRVILDIDNPEEKEKASYGNFDFAEIPFHIKAKYYADIDKKTLNSDNPLLVLRLVDPLGMVLGELSLQKGGSGTLGQYQVRLVRVKRWTGFIFLDTVGIPGVFFGFFIIILGVGLHYFTIPREFHCRKTEDGVRLVWKGSRYQQQYLGEYESIMKELKGQVE